MDNGAMMRDVFIERIYERMRVDDDIFFLSADFGSPKLDAIREEFGDRFINVGIAEQNLINVSTGLALEGFTVYAYAIAPFLTMRAYEQIRVNLALQAQLRELNVNLVGVGAGLSYDVSGPTHHCIEDISIMRTLPNIMVLSPSDWTMAARFADYSTSVRMPKYIRLDGKRLGRLYDHDGGEKAGVDMEDGIAVLEKGSDVCLVGTGCMTHRALRVRDALARENVDAGVIDAFVLEPVNRAVLRDALKGYNVVVTLEEALVNRGGLDSVVSGVLDGSGVRLIRVGFTDSYVFSTGNRDHLHALNGLDENGVIAAIRTVLAAA